MIAKNLVQEVSKQLGSGSLRPVPADMLSALAEARGTSIYQHLESAAHERLPQNSSVLAEQRKAAAKARD